MTKTSRRAVSYAAGLALVTALTACGGGDPAGGGGATSSSSTSSNPTSSGSPTSSATSTTSASSSSTSTPAGRTVEVTITGRKVDPAPATVKLGVGEKLTLTVTSDHDDVLHIHGFDIEKNLKAGQPTTVELTGDAPGVYEVETHEPELRLLKIAVQ
ncbi:cupredoxin domain-containing protein [Knoellia koreensis]|uniref:cupredoxin domain-containing protein n=1 Tax=Knoellia koreensis TaxID=2730921 RepID=UPI003211E339